MNTTAGRWIAYMDTIRSKGFVGGWRWYSNVGQILEDKPKYVIVQPDMPINARKLKIRKERIIEIWGKGPTESGPAAYVSLHGKRASK